VKRDDDYFLLTFHATPHRRLRMDEFEFAEGVLAAAEEIRKLPLNQEIANRFIVSKKTNVRKVEEFVMQLAKEQFGENLVDVDFWGAFDGDDLIGEIILAADLPEQNALDKLGEIYNKVEDMGWTVSLGWIVDNTAKKE
jgi:hypothetical protein